MFYIIPINEEHYETCLEIEKNILQYLYGRNMLTKILDDFSESEGDVYKRVMNSININDGFGDCYIIIGEYEKRNNLLNIRMNSVKNKTKYLSHQEFYKLFNKKSECEKMMNNITLNDY